NRYDEVIHHSAQFLACCAPYPGARYIYSLSIVIRRRTKGLHRASKPGVEWPRIFILYAIWKTARRSDERGAINAPIPREKLYEKPSYVRAWPRSLMHAAVDGKSRRPAAPRDEAFYLDHGPGPSPVAPPSGGVPLHRPPDPRSGKADRGERAEAVGDPPGHGHPRPRDPEVRGSDALDRRLPCGDDGGLEGPGRGRRLDAVVHHDAAQPAVRCVRALAVPPPQGRRVCADRQAPGHLVPDGPGTDRGPRSARGQWRDPDGVHAAQVPPGRRPVPRRGDDPARDRVRPDEPLGRSG